MNLYYLLESIAPQNCNLYWNIILFMAKNKFKNHHGTCPLKSTVALRYEYIETNQFLLYWNRFCSIFSHIRYDAGVWIIYLHIPSYIWNTSIQFGIRNFFADKAFSNETMLCIMNRLWLAQTCSSLRQSNSLLLINNFLLHQVHRRVFNSKMDSIYRL